MSKASIGPAYSDSYSNPSNPLLDPEHRTVARYISNQETMPATSLTMDNNLQFKFLTGPVSVTRCWWVLTIARSNQRSTLQAAAFDPTPFDLYSAGLHQSYDRARAVRRSPRRGKASSASMRRTRCRYGPMARHARRPTGLSSATASSGSPDEDTKADDRAAPA